MSNPTYIYVKHALHSTITSQVMKIPSGFINLHENQSNTDNMEDIHDEPLYTILKYVLNL